MLLPLPIAIVSLACSFLGFVVSVNVDFVLN
jgi:hypothetical protein